MSDHSGDSCPLDPVAAFYEHWVYPEPCADLASLRFDAVDVVYDDPRRFHALYWPQGEPREDLDILVAGCGTMAGACYAYRFPRAGVVGIDVSAASLAHEEALRAKHGLSNLSLRRLALEDIASLNREFDFIACHGVLHHVADPVFALRCLGSTLRRDGVIDAMVYAPYGRTGVYMLQDLFRRLGLGLAPADVQAVKDALAALGPRHPVRTYLTMATDLNTDAGLVDTFLHCRDRAFTCGQCLDLVEQAGLAFQGWQENALYHPDCRLPPTSPMRAMLDRLPERERWQAVELFDGTLPGHRFHACRADRNPADYVLRFDGDAFLDYIPLTRTTHAQQAEPATGQPARIARPPFPPLELDAWQTRLLAVVDHRRTVRDCLHAAGLGDQTPAVEHARHTFRLLWRTGYVMFRIKPSQE